MTEALHIYDEALRAVVPLKRSDIVRETREIDGGPREEAGWVYTAAPWRDVYVFNAADVAITIRIQTPQRVTSWPLAPGGEHTFVGAITGIEFPTTPVVWEARQ